MDKAKAAVSSFLSRDGKHETTVHETVNPAVRNERVVRTENENVQAAVDREVHQDHYHTSVQPIQHQEILPESHLHNLAGVEEREFRHGDSDHVRHRLEEERAQFKSTRKVGDIQHTTVESPTVAGEHIHHHVHETIQPVIQKETIQPSVVHTTIPVHEVHHNEAKHHAVSSLPAISMSEYKSQGGVLGGREERTDAFAGEPRAVSSTLGDGGGHHIGGRGTAGTTSTTEGDNIPERSVTGRDTGSTDSRNATNSVVGEGLRNDGLRNDGSNDGVSENRVTRNTVTTETHGTGLGKGMSQGNTGMKSSLRNAGA